MVGILLCVHSIQCVSADWDKTLVREQWVSLATTLTTQTPTHTNTSPCSESLGSWLKLSGFLLWCSTSCPDGSTFLKLTHLGRAHPFKAFHGNVWHQHFKTRLLAVTYDTQTCIGVYGCTPHLNKLLLSMVFSVSFVPHNSNKYKPTTHQCKDRIFQH